MLSLLKRPEVKRLWQTLESMFPVFPVCLSSCLFYHHLLSPVSEIVLPSAATSPGHGSASSAVSCSSPVSPCTAPPPVQARDWCKECCRHRDLKRHHGNKQTHPLCNLVKLLQFLPSLPLLCFWYFTKRIERAFLVVRSALAAPDCRVPVRGPGSRAGCPCGWEHSQCPAELPAAPKEQGRCWLLCRCAIALCRWADLAEHKWFVH